MSIYRQFCRFGLELQNWTRCSRHGRFVEDLILVQRRHGHLGFEGHRVSLPRCLTHSAAVLSRPAEPEKPDWPLGSKIGVHFSR